jgi:hypothetical protein
VLVISPGAIAAGRGYIRTAATTAAAPDEGTVFYDPDKPDKAWVELHTRWLGHVLVAGGIGGVVIGVLAILVAAAWQRVWARLHRQLIARLTWFGWCCPAAGGVGCSNRRI